MPSHTWLEKCLCLCRRRLNKCSSRLCLLTTMLLTPPSTVICFQMFSDELMYRSIWRVWCGNADDESRTVYSVKLIYCLQTFVVPLWINVTPYTCIVHVTLNCLPQRLIVIKIMVSPPFIQPATSIHSAMDSQVCPAPDIHSPTCSCHICQLACLSPTCSCQIWQNIASFSSSQLNQTCILFRWHNLAPKIHVITWCERLKPASVPLQGKAWI